MIKCLNSITFNFKCWKATFVFLLVLSAYKVSSQPPFFKSPAYINNYSDEAVSQMAEFRIPASVILAQAIFESNCGTSKLAQRSNNHFGIKCHTQWGGDTIVKTDDTLNECFRKYASVYDSYTDHSMFLKSRTRYSALFSLPITDYKSWCKGLKASGYATYPWYAEELIEIIEQNKLYELDRVEKMVHINFFASQTGEVIESRLSEKQHSLLDIFKAEGLFIDEKDVLPQSLEMLVRTEDEEEIVGN